MRCAYCGNELKYYEGAYRIDGEVVCDDCVRTEQFNDVTIEELNKCSFINFEKPEDEGEDEYEN